MNKIVLQLTLIGMTGLILYGCVLEDIPESGSSCEASYVKEENDTECVFGDCPRYDKYLKYKHCPPEIPKCIQDEKGAFYCGKVCPPNYHPYDPGVPFASECELDSSEHCGTSENDCLKDENHVGWERAICNSDKQCEATKCSDTYVHTGADCLTAAQCCGVFCLDCTRVNGKVCSGVGEEGKCIDRCSTDKIECQQTCIDPLTSNTYCGSKNCEPHPCLIGQECVSGKCVCQKGTQPCGKDSACVDVTSDVSNCGACGKECAKTAGWLSGKCIDSVCVPTICASNYHLDGVSEENQSCVKDSVEACGNKKINCKESVSGWVSGQCVEGRCVPEQCADGLVAYVNYCVEPGSECGGTVCGPHEVCDHGSCKCEQDYEKCDGICYNLKDNMEHCGECGHACSVEHADNQCVEGECKFTCHDGYIKENDGQSCRLRQCIEGDHQCNGMMYEECQEDVWQEVESCTFSVSNSEPVCDSNAGCGYQCYENYTKCGDGNCYNLKVDENHCGSCDMSCGGDHVIPSCEGGVCQLICEPGYVEKKGEHSCELFNCSEDSMQCVGITRQKCINNKWIDIDSCQSTKPNAEATCTGSGICGEQCKGGFNECGGSCVNYSNDINHCGDCTTVCNVANATNKCEDGVCSFTCNSGYITTSTGCVFQNCVENKTQCSSDNSEVQICKNNNWTRKEKCNSPSNGSAYCNNSQCIVSCNGNAVMCGSDCRTASKNGMVISSGATIYSSPGSGNIGSAGLHSVYPVYGEYSGYYAIKYNSQKGYISAHNMYIIPVTGKITAENGVNSRRGPGTTYSQVNDKGDGIPSGWNVVIRGFEKESSCNISNCCPSLGWYYVTSFSNPNNGTTRNFSSYYGVDGGYVCADYVDLKHGDSSGLSSCP